VRCHGQRIALESSKTAGLKRGLISLLKLKPSLSRVQKIVIWATLSLSIVPVLYPLPKYFSWTGVEWLDLSSEPRYRERHGLRSDRTFIFDLEMYGAARPNFVRMATESGVILIVGLGLAAALGRSKAATT